MVVELSVSIEQNTKEFCMMNSQSVGLYHKILWSLKVGVFKKEFHNTWRIDPSKTSTQSTGCNSGSESS